MYKKYFLILNTFLFSTFCMVAMDAEDTLQLLKKTPTFFIEPKLKESKNYAGQMFWIHKIKKGTTISENKKNPQGLFSEFEDKDIVNATKKGNGTCYVIYEKAISNTKTRCEENFLKETVALAFLTQATMRNILCNQLLQNKEMCPTENALIAEGNLKNECN